jgi:hypothetical protein
LKNEFLGKKIILGDLGQHTGWNELKMQKVGRSYFFENALRLQSVAENFLTNLNRKKIAVYFSHYSVCSVSHIRYFFEVTLELETAPSDEKTNKNDKSNIRVVH